MAEDTVSFDETDTVADTTNTEQVSKAVDSMTNIKRQEEIAKRNELAKVIGKAYRNKKAIKQGSSVR